MTKAQLSSLVKDAKWTEQTVEDTNTLFTLFLEDGGRITVLDRETGFGFGTRDTETGYKDSDGKFWLASGMCDVRRYCADMTVAEAVEWVKRNANTCVGA